jgi:predicted phosphodiesterase
VAAPLTRIFSDIHYGDRASRVTRLAQLQPLLDGVDHLVLNGDTLDTRPGPNPGYTAQLRAELDTFTTSAGVPLTLLTGNHDPDLTGRHALDLAEGRVFVTHGDILFNDIVPWGRDVPEIKRLIAAELATLTPAVFEQLDAHLALWRRVCLRIPQRHQSERNRLKYALRFAADTVWPPTRVFRVLAAWRRAPALAAALARRHRPASRFILTGHTHRPGIWRQPDGLTVINTGSFCPPTGGCVVDLTIDRLIVRRTDSRGGEFYAGPVIADFALADSAGSAKLPA